MTCNPGCPAGGSVDVVVESVVYAGYPVITAAVGSVVVVPFQVADDSFGHVKSANVSIRKPGNTLRTKSPTDLVATELALAGTSSGRSTLSWVEAS